MKYRCHPTDVHPAVEGVGLVGSTTFVLFDDTNASMPPEDIYGIHCCYELVWADALDAPDERTAAEGRKRIAEHNPGFA